MRQTSYVKVDPLNGTPKCSCRYALTYSTVCPASTYNTPDLGVKDGGVEGQQATTSAQTLPAALSSIVCPEPSGGLGFGFRIVFGLGSFPV